MKTVNTKPPNWNEIIVHLTPPPTAVFCYGDTIYNPSGALLFNDLVVHEEVHAEQQANSTNPGLWWTKYLNDRAFRLDQELEAYGAQFNYVRQRASNAIQKEALHEFAHTLSTMYNLGIAHSQAESLIRKRAKRLSN